MDIDHRDEESSLSSEQSYVRHRRAQLEKQKRRRTRILAKRLTIAGVFILILTGIFLSVSFQQRRVKNTEHPWRTQTDAICYLAAKYESNASPETTGKSVDYMAYGEFQFYYAYTLVPFVRWCVEQDPEFYELFVPYTNMSESNIPGEDFRKAWTSTANKSLGRFENDQQKFVVSHTLTPALRSLTAQYGFSFENASDAVKSCVLSFANREGRYLDNLWYFFEGTTEMSKEREIIEHAYRQMQKKRPDEGRWKLECSDCLNLYDGKLDIYAISKNTSGGIDWTWK